MSSGTYGTYNGNGKNRNRHRAMSRKKRRQQVFRARCLVASVVILLIVIVAFILLRGCTSSDQDDSQANNDNTNTSDITTQESTEETTTDDFMLEGGTVVGQTSKGYNIVELDGITYIKGLMIVNKTYGLPSTYNPGSVYAEVKEAFEVMKAAAALQGLNIWLQSGFRTYERQETLYNNYVEQDGKEAADTYSARPGYSEHQSGYCFDLNTIDESFTNTDEGVWVAEHAHEYGFIIRYPEGKESSTGYMYESWHLRYVGIELATKIYESGESLEEYLGITSEYQD